MSERLYQPNKLVAGTLAALALAAAVAANAKGNVTHSGKATGIESTQRNIPSPELVAAYNAYKNTHDVVNAVLVIPFRPSGKDHNRYFYVGPDTNGHVYQDILPGRLSDHPAQQGAEDAYQLSFPMRTTYKGENWLVADIRNMGCENPMTTTKPEMTYKIWLKASALPKGTEIYQLKNLPAGTKPVVHGKIKYRVGPDGDAPRTPQNSYFQVDGIPTNFCDNMIVTPKEQTQQLANPSVARRISANNFDTWLDSGA